MRQDEPTFDVGLYWGVLQRRFWLLLIPVVLLTGILGLGSFLFPDIYRAQAQAVVRPEQDPLKGLAVESQLTQQLGGVIQSLKQPSQQKEIFERLQSVAPAGLTMQEALIDFQQSLTVQRREEGKDLIVDFVYEGHPEKYAVEVVNAFADEFQQEGARLVATSLVVSLDFVDDQLETYREQLTELESQEQQIRAELSALLGDLAATSGSQNVGQIVAEQLSATETQIQQLNVQVSSASARAQYLRAQLGTTPPTLQLRESSRGDSTEAELERMVAEAQNQLTALQMRYTNQHPQVVTQQEQLAELRARLAEVRRRGDTATSDEPNPAYENLRAQLLQAEAELQVLQAQREQLVERSNRLRTITAQLPTYEARLARLTEEQTALQTTYDSLLQRKQVLELNKSFEQGRNTGRFDIRRAGAVPLQPVRPNRLKFVVLGFLAGLFIGISLALLAEYLDHSIRTPDDLRRYVDAPLLAVLPRAPR